MGDKTTLLFESLQVSRLLLALFLLLAAVALSRGLELISRRLGRVYPRFRLRIEQFSTLVKFLVLVTGVIISILALFGFSKEILLALGGSLVVAIGFGLKDVAASILSGFMILFERPFQVGDRVAFGDVYGDVVSIGLRSTRVRTLDDSIVTIPNSRFMTDPVSSANAGSLDMMAQVDLYVATESDLRLVEKLGREAVLSSRYVYLNKPIQVLFADVFLEEHFCTRVRIKAYVVETRFEKPFQSDLTRRVHEAFRRHGIQPPSHTELRQPAF